MAGGCDLDATRNGATALHAAMECQYVDCIDALLKLGAHVNARDSAGLTPMHVAARNCNEGLYLLVKAGGNSEAETSDEYRRTPLHLAALHRNACAAQLLLRSGAHPNATDSQNRTPLHLAAAEGYSIVASALLEGGADVNAIDDNRYTPLLHATRKGRSSSVAVLLQGGARVNCTAADGNTPLHFAVRYCKPSTPLALLQAGAKANKKNFDGLVPILIAVKFAAVRVVEALVSSGAFVNVADSLGWSPLHFAVWRGSHDTVRILLKAKANHSTCSLTVQKPRRRLCEPYQVEAGVVMPVQLAVRKHSAAILRLLLAAGARANLPWERRHTTPLHDAVRSSSVACTEILIRHGANVVAPDADGNQPLAVAASVGDTSSMKLLLQKSVNRNARNYNGSMPLHLAAERGHAAAVDLMLRARAHPAALDRYGWSPLYLAARNGHAYIVQLLLSTDAKATKSCYAAVRAAVKGGHVACLQALIDHEVPIESVDEDGCTPLYLAVTMNKPKCVRCLLRARPRCNTEAGICYDKVTPLLLAAQRGYLACLQLLLDYGANVHAMDRTDATSLHCAAGMGHLYCMKALLAAGANVDATDNKRQSCLYHAVLQDRHGCARLLIAAGANVNACDAQRLSPLHVAVRRGDSRIVGALLQAGAGAAMNDTDHPLGYSPLHYAVANGRYDCALTLLQAGANDQLIDRIGRKPADVPMWCSQYSYRKTIHLVRTFNRRTYCLLQFRRAHRAHYDAARVFKAASAGRSLELGKRLRLGKLAGGLTMTGVVEGGHRVTPLMAASLHGHTDCVRVLQSEGAEPRETNLAICKERAGASVGAGGQVRHASSKAPTGAGCASSGQVSGADGLEGL